MLRARQLLRVWLACGCLLACCVASASGDVLGGTLGRWLDSEAAPALAETLSRHPRFKGETIRVVAMRAGKPVATSNGLVQAVQQRLTRQLLRANGVRIAWGDEHQECAPPRSIPLLLGIEIEPAGAGSHRLHLGVVDVQEGLWVSGVSHTWKGRLSPAAQAAFKQSVRVGTPGSVENPLPVADRRQVGKLLRAGLGCALPAGLDGAVFVAPASQPAVDSVTRTLAGDLSKTSLTNVTTDRSAAAWVIELQARPTGSAHELVLTLIDAAGERARQQLASVVVTGIETVAALPQESPAAIAEQALISPLRLRAADRKGICFGDQACVEVGFRLNQPAYVLVLSTESRHLRPRSCSRDVRQSAPGERWFRVRVANKTSAPSRPDAGVYVLAIETRSVASRLAAHLKRLCSQSRAAVPMSRWLTELDQLLQQAEHEVAWRSVHLGHTPTGIVRI